VLGRFDEEALSLIDSGATSSLHLPDNCRNTSTVISEVTRLIDADMGASMTGAGPQVEWAWWKDPVEGAALLGAHLTELLDDDVDPTAITVLCAADPGADPLVAQLAPDVRRRVATLTGNNVHNPPAGRIGAVPLGLFKGLENGFVCVTDLPGLDDSLSPNGVAQLYVAMTRPRAGLWMGLPQRLHKPITRLGRQLRKVSAR
jgi:hypothetical protein